MSVFKVGGRYTPLHKPWMCMELYPCFKSTVMELKLKCKNKYGNILLKGSSGIFSILQIREKQG